MKIVEQKGVELSPPTTNTSKVYLHVDKFSQNTY